MIDMPRPKAEQPPAPWPDEHHGKPCYVTRWRSADGKRHSKRFYVASATAATREYAAWVKVWIADPRVREPGRPSGLTVTQLTALYTEWAKRTYTKRGRQSSHVYKITRAIDLLCEMYGERPADSITAPDLAAWREWLIADERTRATINAYLGCAKACYQWSAERGMVKAEVSAGLQSVGWLKAGRTKAKDSKRVESVSIEIVEATVKHLPKHLADMVWLQWFTGMRPDEVCSIRAMDISRNGAVWYYRPTDHKLAHLGTVREVAIGPRARAILKPLVARLGFLFRPGESRRAKGVGKRYTSTAYRRAITRACDRAGVSRWAPNMLRHAFATRVKAEMGIDASRAAMGHTTADTTQLYLDRDRSAAGEVARRLG